MSLSSDNSLRSGQGQYRTSTMIDTLAIVKMLRKAGFSEEQAEAQANVISYSIDNTAVTEVKLLETEKRLEDKINLVRNEIHETEKRLENKIHETEKRLEDKINQVKIELKDEIHQVSNKLLYA